MGWDGSPGGPRYRAPKVLITHFDVSAKEKRYNLLNAGMARNAKGTQIQIQI